MHNFSKPTLPQNPVLIGMSLLMHCMQNYMALTKTNPKSLFMHLWDEELKHFHCSFMKENSSLLQNTGFTLYRKMSIPLVHQIIYFVCHV